MTSPVTNEQFQPQLLTKTLASFQIVQTLPPRILHDSRHRYNLASIYSTCALEALRALTDMDHSTPQTFYLVTKGFLVPGEALPRLVEQKVLTREQYFAWGLRCAITRYYSCALRKHYSRLGC